MSKSKEKLCPFLIKPELSDFFGIQPLAGGDEPRHYKRRFTDKVGAGFIPARKLACIDDDCRRKIESIVSD
jgi:hypothetical protein